ncbi:hypothetical protein HL033_01465 [Neoehrlichia mikurensis]|nr:hypothetical protein [Neoehrlichia mikurensis]QXK92215.1 hypothetical protein IAH97_01460 [Neoehrlichia mikurensis]QXK93908.1 hypothetical protein HL033_01465 [Neoehrlichia mikurensis]
MAIFLCPLMEYITKVAKNLYTQDSVYDGFMDVIHGLKGSNYAVDL